MRYRAPNNAWDEQFEIDYEQNLKDIERDISNAESGIQEAKTNVSKAESDAAKALIDVTTAVKTAESTRAQLDAIVSRDTDSDAMSRQAAIDSSGVDKGNLKKRIDDDYNIVIAQLADVTKNKIGDSNNLPSWLQGALLDLTKYHDDYLRQFGVNVKQPPYNAKGDGVTDDSVAIQLAINDAYNTKKAVYFPPGNYYVTQSLIINDRLSIFGSNQYRGMSGEPTKWECFINSTANKVFIGSTPGTASTYFKTALLMKNISIQGKGVGSTLFDFMQLDKSIITGCMIYNFDYVIKGKITNISDINYNYFIRILTSLISTRQGNIKATIVDSKIHHNYINGSAEGNAVLIDLEAGTYSDIHHNFIDYANTGIKLDNACLLVNVNHNTFDICVTGIYIYGSNIMNINDNMFGKCSKADYTLFSALSSANQTAYSTNDWIAIKVRYGTGNLNVKDNIAYKSDVLISMTEGFYHNIKTSGNLNYYTTGKIVNMARYVDSNQSKDGINLKIEEMNFQKLTALPSAIGAEINTFDGHLVYYQNKLVRNNAGTFVDMMGNTVS